MLDLKDIENLVNQYNPIPKPRYLYRWRIYHFDLAKMKSLVKEVVPYRDTVRIWFKDCPTSIECTIFKAHSNAKKFRLGYKPMEWEQINKKTGEIRLVKSSIWLYSITLFQPERTVFEYLESQYPNDDFYLLNGLEVSLDLITKTKHDAEQLKKFFTAHWIKMYAKELDLREVVKVKGKSGTLYFKEKRGKTDFKMYADRPSKIKIGKPCCHIEVKFQGTEAVKAAKLDLNMFSGQVNFNYRRFWRKYLTLKEINSKKLVKNLLRKNPGYRVCGGNKNRERYISRLIYRAGRIATLTGTGKNKQLDRLTGGISTQMMKKTLKLDTSYVEEINNDGFIPQRRWAGNDYIRKMKKIRY